MIRLHQHSAFLRFLAETKSNEQRIALLKTIGISQMDTLCEILLNVLCGVIEIPHSCKKKLAKYKRDIRKITNKEVGRTTTLRIIISIRSLLPPIIKSALHLLNSDELTSNSTTDYSEEDGD